MSRFFVLGAGGIGLLLQYLIGKTEETILIGRESTKEKLLTEPLKITGAIVDERKVVCKTISDIEKFQSTDFILIASKADSLTSIIEEIRGKLDKNSVVVLCQNGIGLFDSARKKFPELKFLRLNCWMGAQRQSLDMVKLAGTFKFDLSGNLEQKQEIEILEKVLLKTDIRVDVGFDPNLSEWQKALWNIAVNGLCSIVDANNGAILEHKELRAISESLLLEAKTVANHAGVKVSDSDLENVFASLEKTRANINATLQDLRAGRAHEIEYLNGAVVRCANQNDQKAPLNETIVSLVNYLEKVEARRIEVK